MISKDFLLGFGAGKAAGGGGGDVTVQEKNITSNGTYIAPAGKAFSPVHVNVPAVYPYPTYGMVEIKNMFANTIGVKGYSIDILPGGEYVFEPSRATTTIRTGYDGTFVMPVNRFGGIDGYIGVDAAAITTANVRFIPKADGVTGDDLPYYKDDATSAVVVYVRNTAPVENFVITVKT